MLTQQELKEHVTYNKVTGAFLNKKKQGKLQLKRGKKKKTKSGIRLRIYIKINRILCIKNGSSVCYRKYPDGS